MSPSRTPAAAPAAGPTGGVVVEGPVPKHRQLRDILLGLLESELASDAAVPSERDLMTRYGVSRATVREAIGQLVNDGRLYRVRGKGTFVAAPPVESQLHLASFTEDMRRRGHRPSTVVLAAAPDPDPPPTTRSALRLPPGAAAYRLERLRSADGIPMAHEVSWLAASPLPGLLRQDLSGSIYSLLAQRYGLVLDTGVQTVWAECADRDRARLLGVEPGAPLLVFRRLSAAGHLPLEHVTSWYRGDRYRVHMSLDRQAGTPLQRPDLDLPPASPSPPLEES